MADEEPITESPTPDETPTAGVPEGTELETPEGEPSEVVVYDRHPDTDEVLGWHKEVKK